MPSNNISSKQDEEIVRASRFGLLLPPKGEKRQPSASMQPGAYRPSAMLKFPS